ncbi:hypothetical protein [Clostridium sp. CTA-5]
MIYYCSCNSENLLAKVMKKGLVDGEIIKCNEYGIMTYWSELKLM